MPVLATRSATITLAAWIAALLFVFSGQATAHPEVHRLLLALAISSSVLATADRHAAQLAAVAAVSYRAGAAEHHHV